MHTGGGGYHTSELSSLFEKASMKQAGVLDRLTARVTILNPFKPRTFPPEKCQGNLCVSEKDPIPHRTRPLDLGLLPSPGSVMSTNFINISVFKEYYAVFQPASKGYLN